ncbi:MULTISPECIES: hypothetical protein [Exiguobacterium]|uniref:hypothetical protein n=1 Tax=Exiguobacterium TaxID=33986 RepID=UPI00049499FB|nr:MULTISPECIES: hypothetical protein [Exiguobacterium]HBQ75594.1 hypothetical protein [Exiguobacterium sp.]HCD57754.1 hypothetical protein [Exiguobacterium sp.]
MPKKIGNKRPLMEDWYCEKCDKTVGVLYEKSSSQEGERTDYYCFPEKHYLKSELDRTKKQRPRP